MICKKCGNEVDKKAVVCTSCGCKIKKPIYKKWWFWGVIVVIAIAIGASSGGNETTVSNNDNAQNQVEEITYEVVDLQTMFDELDSNAMKAEANYQKKNVEFECKIKSFDSDGSYISVEPVGASEWNFVSAMCYIKNDTQKEFLIQKNVGDIITIKGQVKSIGEVVGYSIDIKEVQ
ncbi:MAG: zinc ribbon domain-containing protein [Clostridia bacterium]|nr:zinc ribbon domain-containing protein [Clostridia bacterium]